jgi:AcrR family transcriptional regulator
MVRKKRPGRYHHGDLRQALIEAAAQVAARAGVEAVVMNTLAKKTGVSVAAPFKHFESREALLLAVAEEGARRLGLRSAAAVANVVEPLEAQRRGAMAYVRFAVEEPGYFRVLTRPESLASPLIAAQNSAARAAMEALFSDGSTSEARRVAARSAAHLTAQALVYGLARMIVDGLLGEVDGATAERLAGEVTSVLGAGLGPTAK